MATNTATNATTEVPGGGQPVFPPFDATTFASQFIWFAIAFAVLYLIISRLAIPQIGGIIDNRRQRIEDDFAEAERMKAESDAAIAAYEQALADARARAQALAAQARDKFNAEAEASRRKLEAELNERLAKADEAIAATKNAAMANIETVAVDTASAIVERLIGTVPAQASVQSAVADVLKSGRAG